MGRLTRRVYTTLPLLLCLGLGAAAKRGVPATAAGATQPAAPRTVRVAASPGTAIAAAPSQSDSFAALIARFSEPAGYFDTDNLISNEASYLHAMGPLRRMGVQGGAYIGVGPDQNFSYIAQIRPRIALIVDIRRGNLLEQLWFKALFALSRNRADYLTLMFGRPPPPFKVPQGADGLVKLLDYLDATPADSIRVASAMQSVHDQLRRFGVALADSDVAAIDRIHRAFIDAGPGLQFTSYGRPPRPYYPTYRRLLLEHDLTGRRDSYLVRDDDFRFVKQMEDQDLVIPVVGDLAGAHALRSIATYLKAHHIPVSAFYTSNVEFYLMRQRDFDRFAANVLALPRAPNAVIIRSDFHGFRFRDEAMSSVPGYISTQIVQPMSRFVATTEAGGYQEYRALLVDTAAAR
jgi:hypothetical protein